MKQHPGAINHSLPDSPFSPWPRYSELSTSLRATTPVDPVPSFIDHDMTPAESDDSFARSLSPAPNTDSGEPFPLSGDILTGSDALRYVASVDRRQGKG